MVVTALLRAASLVDFSTLEAGRVLGCQIVHPVENLSSLVCIRCLRPRWRPCAGCCRDGTAGRGLLEAISTLWMRARAAS